MEVFCRVLMFSRPTETLANAADCPPAQPQGRYAWETPNPSTPRSNTSV